MKVTEEYFLPDIDLIHKEEKQFIVWQPEKRYLILGQSNKAETSIFLDKAAEDNIQILKRPSGGESVILTPNTIVSAAVLQTERFENPKTYFELFNNIIISALSDLGVKNLGFRGISDIAIGEKKILGSSIYRTKEKVLYHSVLNVSEDINNISKYLKHPKKEPDYRKGRDHKDFVTSLHIEGYKLSFDKIIETLNKSFSGRIPRRR